jgi:hypothetical protein
MWPMQFAYPGHVHEQKNRDPMERGPENLPNTFLILSRSLFEILNDN